MGRKFCREFVPALEMGPVDQIELVATRAAILRKTFFECPSPETTAPSPHSSCSFTSHQAIFTFLPILFRARSQVESRASAPAWKYMLRHKYIRKLIFCFGVLPCPRGSFLAAHHAHYPFDSAVLLRSCLCPVVCRRFICRDGVSNCKGWLTG